MSEHKGLRIRIKFYLLDSWDSELVMIKIDGVQEVRLGDFRQRQQNICGYEFFSDYIFDYEKILSDHVASTVTIEITNNLDWPATN